MLNKILISSLILITSSVYALDTDLYVFDKDGQKRTLTNSSKEDMSVFVSNNVTRKSITENVECKDSINILKTDKFMHIESKEFGPAPVELIVLDKDGKELYKTSEEAVEYNFKVNLKEIENAKLVKIVNFFGDLQLCKKVAFE